MKKIFKLKIYKLFIGLIITVITILLFTSQQRPRPNVQEVKVSTAWNFTPINGFISNASSYEIINLPQNGRNNVIKISGGVCSWNVIGYPLAAYQGKLITIHFTADVMRTGAEGMLLWQFNNEPDYPSIYKVDNAQPGVWYEMKASVAITPTAVNPFLYLTTYASNSYGTTYYFDNLNIKIDTWDYTPDTVLQTAGETNSNGTRNLYVSINKGTDDGNGTQVRPFKKIIHAMYYVKPGDTVLVDSGTYYEKFRIPSGSEGKPVTLTAMPNAEVIITPTVPITTQWRQHSRDIYVTDISEYVNSIDTEFPQLFADRDSMVEARFPNMGTSMSMIHDYLRDIAGRGTNKNTVVASKDIPSDIIGSRVVICPGTNGVSWETASSLVQSIKSRTIKLALDITNPDPYTDSRPYTPSPGNPFYITGALALLDAPGEYYFDSKTNLLYFFPPWYGKPDTRLLTLRGNIDTAIYAENTSFINIKNITVYGGGIFMKNTRNSILENCKINYAEHFYHNGINSRIRMERMIVSGLKNRIERCEFGPTAGNGIVLEGDDNIFTNNIVHDTSYAGSFPYMGISVNRSKRLEISHNSIINSAHSHIRFAEAGLYQQNPRIDYERCIIRNNLFENHSTLNSDGGAFYAWGSDGGGTEIFNNFVICGNKNNQGAFEKLRYGLYADNNTQNYIVSNNIIIGGSAGLTMNLPSKNVIFKNNTVIGAEFGISMFGIPKDNADASTSFFTDNLFVDTKKKDISYWGTENNKEANYNGNFVNGTVPAPVRANARVKSSSNARGTVDDQYRPTGRTPDIGAIPRNGEMFKYGADWNLGNK